MFADLLEIVLVPCPYILLLDGGPTMNVVGIEVQKSNGTDQRKKEDE